MNIHVTMFAALTLASVPAAAGAQVTQTYQYDANGRLTGVATSGPAGTNTAAYVYDDADNRTSRSQTGVVYAAILQLPADQALRPDQALVSADGGYSFALRPSGKLELWSGDAGMQSPASETIASAFLVGADGQARFEPRGIVNDWPADARLSLSNDGDLVLLDGVDGTALWRPTGTDGEPVAR